MDPDTIYMLIGVGATVVVGLVAVPVIKKSSRKVNQRTTALRLFNPAGTPVSKSETILAVSEQNQRTEKQSVAIQSGRDTVIQQGISAEDMRAIIAATGDLVKHEIGIARELLRADMKELLDSRLTDFDSRLLERFADTSSSRLQAFADPDFQYVVRQAQLQFARSGDEAIRDSLIDLIAKRSLESNRSRLSLTLNDAIEKAAVLTRNEFAELSACFLLRYTQHRGLGTLQALADHLNVYLIPLLDDIFPEQSSYSYLEAHSCAKIELTSIDFYRLLVHSYGGLFSKGFDRDQILAQIPEEHRSTITECLMPCLNDKTKMQLNILNRELFLSSALRSAPTEEQLTNVYNFFENTFWTEQELMVTSGCSHQELSKQMNCGRRHH